MEGTRRLAEELIAQAERDEREAYNRMYALRRAAEQAARRPAERAGQRRAAVDIDTGDDDCEEIPDRWLR